MHLLRNPDSVSDSGKGPGICLTADQVERLCSSEESRERKKTAFALVSRFTQIVFSSIPTLFLTSQAHSTYVFSKFLPFSLELEFVSTRHIICCITIVYFSSKFCLIQHRLARCYTQVRKTKPYS